MLDQKLFLIFFVSFSVTFFTIFLLRPLAKYIGMIDRPSDRKKHYGEIPIIGGISIFIGFNVSILGEYSDNNILLAVILSSFIILILGFVDDYHPLPATIKIFVQIIIVSYMIWITGLRFETFGHSFGLTNQVHLGILSYPITVLGIVFVTNAYNLMDGADGVAGCLVILALIGINIIDFTSGIFYVDYISIGLCGCLIAFLYFNLTKKTKNKIFLGDSGSLFLGYLVACLLLYQTQINKSFSPTYALWIIAIPVFDVITVMIHRIKKSKFLFSPDRSHLHHILQNMQFSNVKVLLYIIVFAILASFIGLLIESKSQHLSFIIYLALLFIYIWIRLFTKLSKYNS